MKLFEDFLDNIDSEEIVNKSASNCTEAYDYIAYVGTSVDTFSQTPEEESEKYYS